ncbi:MAG TPA: CRISPR-associated endonuclease Cas3'', partial [Clostridia bacterium]|nr:CRISPR-associated endonuclease Cas3'' [Clostridia bacterium]
MPDSARLPASLWAKKSRTGEMAWLPLAVHLADCAQVARLLWRDWVPEGVKRTLALGLQGNEDTQLQQADLEKARRLFIFLAASHDLGKATPSFQYRPAFPACPVEPLILESLYQEGFQAGGGAPLRQASYQPHHSLAGQLLLERLGLSSKLANVVGAHHGKPGSSTDLIEKAIAKFPGAYGHRIADGAAWKEAQQALVSLALSLGGWQSLADMPVPDAPAQLLLSALVIIADWIASAEDLFPLFAWEKGWDIGDAVRISADRAKSAWARLKLPLSWIPGLSWMQNDFLSQRFAPAIPGFMPRLAQEAAVDHASGILQPGILVLEAPMGSGKTEAALAIAEIFAQKTERAGLFFALPTQATGDAMFARVQSWADGLLDEGRQSIRLAHGKAQFNPDYLRLFEADSTMGSGERQGSLFVHEWFAGQKKALLADFVVGTIDQLLLAALRQKHVMLRHLGLAGKVVIIDECHAYDAYMSRYLARALRWLGRYQVPVIVLSATLPAERRKQVIAAYLGHETPRGMAGLTGAWQTSREYPLMTW